MFEQLYCTNLASKICFQIDTIHRAYGSVEHIEDISMAEDLRLQISAEGCKFDWLTICRLTPLNLEGESIADAWKLAIEKQSSEDRTPAAAFAKFV